MDNKDNSSVAIVEYSLTFVYDDASYIVTGSEVLAPSAGFVEFTLDDILGAADYPAAVPASSVYSVTSITLNPGEGDSWRIGGISLSTDVLQDPFVDVYSVDLIDADGDFVSDSFSVIYDPDVAQAAPVALDLDGDGSIAYLGLEAGVHFDFDSDGHAEATSWVSSADGILVYDADGDGAVSSADEISFTSYHPAAETDLQGLSLAFDSNHDGHLNVLDNSFSAFAVWQDLNSDGVSDSGELMSLERVGIADLDLTGDGLASVAAGGDVLIHGSTLVTYADGSTTFAQDVEFATMIDTVLADPSVLGTEVSAGISDQDAFVADDLQASALAVATAVEAFLASEPVTEADVATFEQDVQLAETSDPEPLDLPDGDTAAVEPVADVTIDDGSVDADFDHDVLIDHGAVQDAAIYDYSV
jgi:hypothetical protein